MGLNKFTIFLLKSVDSLADAVSEPDRAKRVDFNHRGVQGQFWWIARTPSQPAWVGFIAPLIDEVPAELTSSSASGLLLIRVGEESFALTFGYGRSLLKPDAFVRGFGLRVALNRIDSAQLRSMDTKAYEDLVVARTTQASKSTELRTFGIEPMRDLLRAVTGQPTSDSLGKRLTGSDALVLNVEVEAEELPGLLAEALAAYREDSYKRDFGWVDQLSLVSDPSTVGKLDALLVEALQKTDTSSTHLAIPDAIEWADIHAFKLAGTRGREYEDLDLDEYLAALEAPAAITLEALKGRGVSISYTRSTDDWNRQWSVYGCLVSEQRLDGRLYALFEGRWFAVAETLVSRVDEVVDSIPGSGLALPHARAGETEPAYNERVAADCGYVSLDAKILKPEGARTGVEFCDILAPGGLLVHVKRKSRSATLSHLFAQGLVSTRTMIGDGEFRDRVRGEIELNTSGLPPDDVPALLASVPPQNGVIRTSDFTVVYAVIANSKVAGARWLPFFSKLNLMQTTQALRSQGFHVALDRIAVD